MATILLADADAQLVDTLSTAAEALGHTVVTTTNGLEARNLLAKQRFDCVLLDVELPRVSGVRLLQMIRKHPRHFRKTGVALMCGPTKRAAWLLEQAREAPPNALLSKPFGLKDFTQAVDVLVSGDSAQAFRLGRNRRLSLLETTEF